VTRLHDGGIVLLCDELFLPRRMRVALRLLRFLSCLGELVAELSGLERHIGFRWTA
jgi:hypothetical protein